MPFFSYVALDSAGKETRGRLEAGSERDVIQALREQGLFVVNLNAAKNAGSGATGEERSLLERMSIKQYLKVTDTHRIFLFRQLAMMLRSGLTIVQSLNISSELVERRRLSLAVQRMSHAIQGGASFSDSLKQEKIFKPIVANLVASGEETGEVDRILERLSDNMEMAQDRKRTLFVAMLYPGIVFFSSIGVIVFLMMKVVPDYAEFFANRGQDLPTLMGFLLDVSDFFLDWGAFMGSVVGITIFLILAAYTTLRGKAVIDHVLLKIPFIGKAIEFSAVSEFGVTLSMLLRSGMTVLEGLRVMTKVMTNVPFARSLETAGNDILAGQSLAAALDRDPMPKLVSHMVAVGEQSGELDTVLDNIGEFHSKKLQNSAKLVIAFIEPALIMFVGGIVLVVYLSIVQTVFSAINSI